MNLWSIFITGLFAGGASCAAVQGGLLVASVVRRGGQPTVAASMPAVRPPRVRVSGKNARKKQQRARARFDPAAAARRMSPPVTDRTPLVDDVVPVGGFLVGKLVSHTALGALLGLFGASVQISYSGRALMQIAAGLFMLLIAAHLFGVPRLAWVVPKPPARLAKLVRRSARSEALFAPVLLGFLTCLIPCGVTLSIMFLAVASGSPVSGAAAMATFVVGTSPLFAAIGYAVRRTSVKLKRTVAMLSAAAVLIAGLLALNSGLVLRGSSFTLASVVKPLTGNASSAVTPTAPVDASGVQQLALEAKSSSYSPSRLAAKAGVPSTLTITTNGTTGCTRAFVVPDLGIQKVLPETGDTRLDLGELAAGSLRFTCSMGMYSGVIDVV